MTRCEVSVITQDVNVNFNILFKRLEYHKTTAISWKQILYAHWLCPYTQQEMMSRITASLSRMSWCHGKRCCAKDERAHMICASYCKRVYGFMRTECVWNEKHELHVSGVETFPRHASKDTLSSSVISRRSLSLSSQGWCGLLIFLGCG